MICEPDRSAVDNIEIEKIAGTDDNPGVDVCGCATRLAAIGAAPAAHTTAPEPQVEEQTGGADSGSPAFASHIDRAVKLVARLRPLDAAIEAQLAVGADGCDPHVQMVLVVDIEAAVQALVRLLDQSLAAWRVQPRFPMIGGSASVVRSRTSTPLTAMPRDRRPVHESTQTHSTGEMPSSENSAQMTLFE
jgi:hypothetical protein